MRSLTTIVAAVVATGVTLSASAQVVVTIPGQEVDPATAVERLQAALKRARAEAARSRSDAA